MSDRNIIDNESAMPPEPRSATCPQIVPGASKDAALSVLRERLDQLEGCMGKINLFILKAYNSGSVQDSVDALNGIRHVLAEDILAAQERPVTPQAVPCGNDSTCPCQDGDACHYTEENPMPVPPAAPEPQRYETAWLIEEAGKLCIGVCEGRLRWVCFTDPLALRFARKSDAEAFVSVCRREWKGEKVAKALENTTITEHLWISKRAEPGPESPSVPARKKSAYEPEPRQHDYDAGAHSPDCWCAIVASPVPAEAAPAVPQDDGTDFPERQTVEHKAATEWLRAKYKTTGPLHEWHTTEECLACLLVEYHADQSGVPPQASGDANRQMCPCELEQQRNPDCPLHGEQASGDAEEIARRHAKEILVHWCTESSAAKIGVEKSVLAAITEARQGDAERIAELERQHHEAMILVRTWAERANTAEAERDRLAETLAQAVTALATYGRHAYHECLYRQVEIGMWEHRGAITTCKCGFADALSAIPAFTSQPPTEGKE
jgi:hypothetical protein